MKENTISERMGVLENEVRNIKEQNTTEHTEIKKMISDFIESADKKYASKWTERLVYGLVVVILSGLIGGAISQLYK
jgi:hypothetical protein